VGSRVAAAVALGAPHLALAGDGVDPPLQLGDPVAHPAPVDLQLGLAGASPADAAGQPGQRVVALGQPGEQVLELGQLHLELAVRALGALGEDVQDELGAVQHLERGGLGDVPGLGRGQVLVEDDEVRHLLHGAEVELVQLAVADEVARVRFAAGLHHLVDDVHPGGAGQLRQLVEGGL